MGEFLKLDLDLSSETEVISLLTERLKFLNDVKLLPFNIIDEIILIKKNNYSVKILLSKTLKIKQELILFQSILGSDYKHTAITYRDYKLGLRNYNRLFDVKRNIDGEYIFSNEKSIFNLVFISIWERTFLNK